MRIISDTTMSSLFDPPPLIYGFKLRSICRVKRRLFIFFKTKLPIQLGNYINWKKNMSKSLIMVIVMGKSVAL